MKVLKAFIQPFEAPQRSAKIKFNLIFISIQFSEMQRTEGFKYFIEIFNYRKRTV